MIELPERYGDLALAAAGIYDTPLAGFFFGYKFFHLIIYPQKSLDSQFEEAQKLFEEFSLIKGEKQFFYNKSENILDLGNYTAPLSLVKMEYFFDDANNKNFVYLKCIDKKPCLNNSTFELGIPFKTKKNCYDFINALAELNKISLEDY